MEDLKSFFMDKSEPSLPSSKSLKERGPKLSDEQRVVDLLARRVRYAASYKTRYPAPDALKCPEGNPAKVCCVAGVAPCRCGGTRGWRWRIVPHFSVLPCGDVDTR